jgi:hypothetical protein
MNPNTMPCGLLACSINVTSTAQQYIITTQQNNTAGSTLYIAPGLYLEIIGPVAGFGATGATGPSGPALAPGTLQGDYLYWNGVSAYVSGSQTVTIGGNAGVGAGSESVAVGYLAGNSSQGFQAVAVGAGAGQTNQSTQTVAIGVDAAMSGQAQYGVAVGNLAGGTSQGTLSVAVGFSAGASDQGSRSVGVGYSAGGINQGTDATALGGACGYENQGSQAVAIGYNCAGSGQGANAVALGANSAQSGQGAYAIAIGSLAGMTNQPAGSISINASGVALNEVQTGCYINPIRVTQDLSAPFITAYNTGTSELTDYTIYGTAVGTSVPVLINSVGNLGTTVSSRRYKHDIIDMDDQSNSIMNFRPVTYIHNNDSTNTRRFGLIAEEVQELCPDLVLRKNGVPDTVLYHEMIAPLLNELQKLSKRVDAIEGKSPSMSIEKPKGGWLY